MGPLVMRAEMTCDQKLSIAGFVRLLSIVLSLLLSLTVTASANHGPRTWQVAQQSVLVVEPTWPGYARPGFGAPPGVAPAGTGIVYPLEAATGSYILTAAHVVARAVKIEVVDTAGSRYQAHLHGIDRRRDVAVLHVDEVFPTIALSVGDPPIGSHVCALVNAFGLGISLTCGVVSATGRSNVGFNEIEDFVQTDAAVNPGASGGALVSPGGQLVGMIDGIFTKEADIDGGVNFAVSLPMIKQSLEAMRANGVRF